MTIASNHNTTPTCLIFERSKKSYLQSLLNVASSLIFGNENYKFMLNCYKEKMEIGLFYLFQHLQSTFLLDLIFSNSGFVREESLHPYILSLEHSYFGRK